MNKKQIIVASLLIGLGLITRLAWHPANTTALAAIAIMAGFYFDRKLAWLIPVSILLISDIFLGGYELPVMISVYASFILVAVLGGWLKNKLSIGKVVGAVLLPSTLFFVLTNFAVWAFTPWYVKSLSGLALCFASALPFWRNMLVGDLVWLPVVFGVYYAASQLSLIYIKPPKVLTLSQD